MNCGLFWIELCLVWVKKDNSLPLASLFSNFSIPKSGDTKLHFEEYFPFPPKQATINQNYLFHKLTSTFPQNPQRVIHIKSTGNQQVTHKVFHRKKILESRQNKHFGSCPQFPHPLLLLLLPINNIYYIIFVSDIKKKERIDKHDFYRR